MRPGQRRHDARAGTGLGPVCRLSHERAHDRRVLCLGRAVPARGKMDKVTNNAHQAHNHDHAHAHNHGSSEVAAGATAIDPVCGMTVDPHKTRPPPRLSRPHLLLLLGRLPHQIRRRPGKVSRQAGRRPPAAPPGTIYTCPMHPQIRQVGPGTCPICGMALEPARADGGDRPESRARRHDAAVLDRPRAGAAGRRCSRWAGISLDLHMRARRRCRTGSSSCWRRRSCCGPAGRSSCAAGSRSSPATSTCSR